MYGRMIPGLFAIFVPCGLAPAFALPSDADAVAGVSVQLEVAKLLVDLYEQTSRGCFDLANTVQQQQQQRATGAAQSRCANPVDGEGARAC